jgi:hypothetical protein
MAKHPSSTKTAKKKAAAAPAESERLLNDLVKRVALSTNRNSMTHDAPHNLAAPPPPPSASTSTKDPAPLANANWLSKLVLTWLEPLAWRANAHNKAGTSLQLDDVDALPRDDQPQRTAPRLSKAWAKHLAAARRAGTQPSLGRVIAREFGYRIFLQAGFFMFLLILSSLAIPVSIRSLVKFLVESNVGFAYAVS